MSQRVGHSVLSFLDLAADLAKGQRLRNSRHNLIIPYISPNWPKISSGEVALLASLEYIITRFRNAAINAEIDNKPLHDAYEFQIEYIEAFFDGK